MPVAIKGHEFFPLTRDQAGSLAEHGEEHEDHDFDQCVKCGVLWIAGNHGMSGMLDCENEQLERAEDAAAGHRIVKILAQRGPTRTVCDKLISIDKDEEIRCVLYTGHTGYHHMRRRR